MSNWVKLREHRTLTGRPWRRLRDKVLARDKYTCQVCKRITDQLEVDHIIPLANKGTDEMDNLQSLCVPCHEAKSKADQGHKERVEVGLDGWPK